MPRIARAVLAGHPHHVIQRGNYRQAIFDDDEDRQMYLRWLCQYKAKHGLLVWAWCLMDNHVHLVCVPQQTESLAQTLRSAHMRYAGYLNRKRRRQGHLWQGRFSSCVLDEEHLWTAIRYVERNPVRAQLVDSAQQYAWSSARAHVTGQPDGVLDDGLWEGSVIGEAGDWASWLRQPEEQQKLRRLRAHTHSGRPLGSRGFLAQVEALLQRRLNPLPRGRPRKRP